MSRPIVLAAVALCALSFAVAGGDARAADPTTRVVYGGKVEDAHGRPIGGIYPLTFSFFRTAKGGRALWSETHFVAVDNGVYAVELGRDKAFPRTLDLDKSFIGISIGAKEIVRERFEEAGKVVPTPDNPVPTPAPSEPPVGAPPQTAKGTYADQAGFAYEAEKAKTADSVGGLTATDLRNLVKQSASDATPKDGGGKAKIGETKRYSEQVGGLGGQPFTLQCPAGFMVTGIRGQAAGYVDQISLICSPLE